MAAFLDILVDGNCIQLPTVVYIVRYVWFKCIGALHLFETASRRSVRLESQFLVTFRPLQAPEKNKKKEPGKETSFDLTLVSSGGAAMYLGGVNACSLSLSFVSIRANGRVRTAVC